MTSPARPRVILADDYVGLLTAFERLLRSSCEVVGQVTDSDALIHSVARLKPDVVVLDLFMNGSHGLDACHQIKALLPHTKIVIVTAADDEELQARAFQLGASAFVPKFRADVELLPAIHRVFSERIHAGE